MCLLTINSLLDYICFTLKYVAGYFLGGPDAGESGGTISQFPSTAVSSGAAQGKAGGAAGVGRETGLQGSAVTHRLVPGIQSVSPTPLRGYRPYSTGLFMETILW